jgi:hypothetical protein
MSEFTLEEYESRDITIHGFIIAMFDVFIMGLFILGGVGAASLSIGATIGGQWFYLAISIFLIIYGCGNFTKLLSPRNNYECVVKKDNVTTYFHGRSRLI